jgi:agmatine deiminase
MDMLDEIPSEIGLSMPAEWSPHRGCLVSWPCRPPTFLGLIKKAEAEYMSVIEAISEFEPVTVLSDPSTADDARAKVGEGTTVLQVDLDDSWIRDNGPIFVTSSNSGVAMVDFMFNAWGEKGPYEKDDAVPAHLSRAFGAARYAAPMVLEGGSISVDGEGTLMTTEQCLLHPNRNPSMDRDAIEDVLKRFLGVTKILWLGSGQADDVTDGHVDGVACFCGPKAVMIARTKDEADPNYEMLVENRERLETMTDAKGRSIEIMDLIQPSPREVDGQMITPGYINHYVANGGVVAPEFGIREDALAADMLRSFYADRKVTCVSVPHIEIGGGGIHCITQQIPDGRFANP